MERLISLDADTLQSFCDRIAPRQNRDRPKTILNEDIMNNVSI